MTTPYIYNSELIKDLLSLLFHCLLCIHVVVLATGHRTGISCWSDSHTKQCSMNDEVFDLTKRTSSNKCTSSVTVTFANFQVVSTNQLDILNVSIKYCKFREMSHCWFLNCLIWCDFCWEPPFLFSDERSLF